METLTVASPPLTPETWEPAQPEPPQSKGTRNWFPVVAVMVVLAAMAGGGYAAYDHLAKKIDAQAALIEVQESKIDEQESTIDSLQSDLSFASGDTTDLSSRLDDLDSKIDEVDSRADCLDDGISSVIRHWGDAYGYPLYIGC